MHSQLLPQMALLPPANEVWGKVMCLQVCVCPEGGACSCSRGVCSGVCSSVCSGGGGVPGGDEAPTPAPGGVWSGRVPAPRGSVCSRGCLLWGVPGGDPPNGYCCGRYASYWNAFLFLRNFNLSVFNYYKNSSNDKVT